jgi:hypothetical protein
VRIWKPLARLSWWPALAGALVPKCPLCVAAYLSAAGVGAGVASAAAPSLIRASYTAAALGAVMLVRRLLAKARRTWRQRTAQRSAPTAL